MSVPRVPFLDLRRGGLELDADLKAAFARVLESGTYILGPEVEAFERACMTALGVEHAVGVSSGSDALLASLMALDVGPGDEVVCPAFTFIATAGAVARLGATPVFADSCPRCFNLLPSSVDAAMTPRTKVIVAVHLFGALADLDALEAIASRRSIPLVEDAAQAFGTAGAGTRGALGCFSFFPSKNLGALGDAGLVATSSSGLAERIRILRTHGGKPKYHYPELGGNFRLDALQAALLSEKLPRVPSAIAARRDNAAEYARLFGERRLPIVLPTSCNGASSHHQYCIRVSDRDALREHLRRAGIGTEVYYPEPLHLQPCFSGLRLRKGSLPVAEALARESLALPIFPGLRQDEIALVVAAVAAFFER